MVPMSLKKEKKKEKKKKQHPDFENDPVCDLFFPWFQILTDSDLYRQYHIGTWDTWYDINPIISADIEADISDIAHIDDRYCR